MIRRLERAVTWLRVFSYYYSSYINSTELQSVHNLLLIYDMMIVLAESFINFCRLMTYTQRRSRPRLRSEDIRNTSGTVCYYSVSSQLVVG